MSTEEMELQVCRVGYERPLCRTGQPAQQHPSYPAHSLSVSHSALLHPSVPSFFLLSMKVRAAPQSQKEEGGEK